MKSQLNRIGEIRYEIPKGKHQLIIKRQTNFDSADRSEIIKVSSLCSATYKNQNNLSDERIGKTYHENDDNQIKN